MKNILRTVSVCLLLLVANLACAQANRTSGEALYTSKCAACHGRHGGGKTQLGQMVGVKSFDSSEVLENVSNWRDIITNGKGKMPGYGGSLSNQQIGSLVRYIQVLQQPADKQQYA